MRVTFFRAPDHQRGQGLIVRDDGVVYGLDIGPVTAAPPHDLVHLTVEDALGIADGIWGAIAGGVVWENMQHRSGRRPPHATERSAAIRREHREVLRRAELVGGLVERIAARPGMSLDAIVRMTRQPFRSLPQLVDIDPAAIASAAEALRRAARTWAAVPVGGELVCEWPAGRRLRVGERRREARSTVVRSVRGGAERRAHRGGR